MTNTNKEFKVENRNTYSLAALVKSTSTTSIAQFMQIQTLCYYYDIAVYCSESRATTCDLLTELNNAAQAGELPIRANRKGRAYLNRKGIMVFSDHNCKPLPYQKLIGSVSDLTLSQATYINNALLKNYKKGLQPAEKAVQIVPGNITVESITKTMLEVVKLYKITFDLNRSLEELYEAQNKCALAIKADRLTLRKVSGESYIENQVICFRTAVAPAEETTNVETEEIKEEEVTKDVAHATSFCIFSKPNEDKTARIIYIQEDSMIYTLETKYRTSITQCTCLAIKHIAENGYSDAVIYIDEKAKDLIAEPGEYTTELEKLTQTIAKDNSLELKLADKKSQNYLDFIAQCK